MKPKNKTPQWIKDELKKAGINQAYVARSLEVTKTHIGHVIHGKSVSHKVRLFIANAIHHDLKKIWPETYLVKKDPTKKGRPATKIKKIKDSVCKAP